MERGRRELNPQPLRWQRNALKPLSYYPEKPADRIELSFLRYEGSVIPLYEAGI